MSPHFFTGPEQMRRWLEKHHQEEKELLVGFYKKATGTPSLSWSESVDEAISFGWIDGIRKSVDESRYTIRFTPRKSGSIWSKVNIRKAEELTRQGRMKPAGSAAFEQRREDRSGIYSFEQYQVTMAPAYEKMFRKAGKAWKYFSACPASYRKTATWWVMSAKTELTRQKRLQQLITDSGNGVYIRSQRRNPSPPRSKKE